MAETTLLITGANRGIGLAMVQESLSQGYRVVATARDIEKAADLRALTDKSAGKLVLLALDVNSDASVKKMAAAVSSVDVLINNAAVFPEEGEETFDRWQTAHLTEAFQTNVVGVARVTQALLPLLKKSTFARVVNISSTAGSISGKRSYFYYAYSTSKAALNMLTRSMAFDLTTQGIIAVAVHPGWVQTEMGGSDATLTPTESASEIVGMLENLTLEQAGCFLERDGSPCRQAW